MCDILPGIQKLTQKYEQYEERNSDIFSCTMYIGWKMKYLSQHECKTSHNEVYTCTCSRKKNHAIRFTR